MAYSCHLLINAPVLAPSLPHPLHSFLDVSWDHLADKLYRPLPQTQILVSGSDLEKPN